MPKGLLVLAASTYQLEVIETARRLGLRVVTTDNVADNPGHRLADRAHGVDTTDTEAVLALAAAEGVAGVIAACTDVAVPTAARVAERLGLPGVPPAAAERLCDKAAFRELQAELGLPAPAWQRVAPGASPAAMPLPVVVKPLRASGSRGVSRVDEAGALAPAVRAAQAECATGACLVEEFLPGRQATCEGVVAGGAVTFACLTDRDTAPRSLATSGHRVPARSEPARAEVVAQLDRVFRALGVRDTVFDCDLVAGDDVRLLEVSPRLGGNAMARLVRAAHGVDLVELAVRHAVGEPVTPPVWSAPRPAAVVILGVPEGGRLEYDPAAIAALAAEPWVERLVLDRRPGDRVEAFVNGRHRVGEALLRAADRAELDRRVAELAARLALRTGDVPA